MESDRRVMGMSRSIGNVDRSLYWLGITDPKFVYRSGFHPIDRINASFPILLFIVGTGQK